MKIREKAKKIKNHFIPHKGNDYNPHLLRHESMLVIFMVIIIIELVFLAQVFLVFDKTKFLASVLPGVLTNLTNDIRSENKITSLISSPLLEKAAQLKANDMATRGYFSHNTPDGKTPWYFLDQAGYKYKFAGENLAVNFFESTDVSRAWMNSATHKANIVKKDYTEIGIAVASGMYEGKHTVFVVQFFGTPSLVKSVATATVKNTTKEVSKITTIKTPKTTPTKTLPKASTPAVPVPIPTPILTQVLGEEANTKATFIPRVESKIKLFFEKILTSPSTSVNYILTIILLVISIVLLLVLFIRSEMHHPAIMTRGVLMISVIILLLYVNINVFHFRTEVPENSLEANVIAY